MPICYAAEEFDQKKCEDCDARSYCDICLPLDQARADLAAARAAMLEIYGHLAAAAAQSIPSDDQIIAGHIRDARDLAKAGGG